MIGSKLQKFVSKVSNHRHFQKYEKYVSLIFWLAAIYYLSSQSLNIFVAVDIWEFILRKFAHMFEYAILALLIFRILRQTEKRHIYWDIGWAFIFTVLYAISDEYHQTFTSGRVGNYFDVMIDAAGALISIWLIYLDFHHRKILESKSVIGRIEKIIKGTH